LRRSLFLLFLLFLIFLMEARVLRLFTAEDTERRRK
jgi:hypothetical protein